MRLGKLFGVPVKVHPVTFPLAALAVWLGEGERLMIMTGSILFHELMHIAAARVLRVRVSELEATPMGGAARLENLWRLRPGQMTAVALAGPAGNLLLTVCAAALCWWRILPARLAAALIEQNLVILLFNMLPALPMDGGRVLCGLLERRLSTAVSARIGLRIGQGVAALLAVLSAYGLTRGRLNVTLPMAALFLLTSGRSERRQAESAWLESATGRAAELEEERALPVCWLAVREDVTAREAAMRMKPRHMHVIAICDERLRVKRIVEEEELMRAVLANGERRMEEIGRREGCFFANGERMDGGYRAGFDAERAREAQL